MAHVHSSSCCCCSVFGREAAWRNASKAGVEMMTFDNADELHKIARTYPRAKLVVRILTDDSKSLCALGTKFGAPLVTVPGLLATARRLDLSVIGVSFHVGSGCFDVTTFADAVARARGILGTTIY